MSKTKGGAKYTHTPLFVVMFFISYALKHAHSARYLLGEHPREPVPVRAADAQARERVAVLDAAGVAAAVAERNANHKRGHHGQHAPEDDARRRHDELELADKGSSDEGKSDEDVHSSETQGCLRKYEMIINSHAWSLIMY